MTYGLGPLPEKSASALSIVEIQRIVAESFGIRRADLLGSSRIARVSLARHTAVYLAYRRIQDRIAGPLSGITHAKTCQGASVAAITF